MNELLVRKASMSDLDRLVVLFDQYRIFYRKASDLAGAKKFLSERFALADSEIFVCESDQKLTGFVQLYPLFSSTQMKRLWLLNDLFVDPKFRGMGVSIQLIERAKQLIKETSACGICLETEKTNDIGNQLYPRAGFELSDANHYEWHAQ